MTRLTLETKTNRHRKKQKRYKVLHKMLKKCHTRSSDDVNLTTVTKPYTSLNRVDSRLAQFVGSEAKPDSEPTERLSAAKYLESPEQHAKFLQEYAEKVQSALNTDEILPDWPAARSEGESFEKFIDKGSDALIQDHRDLVEKLI